MRKQLDRGALRFDARGNHAAATLESGKNNTKSAGNVALQVKMSTTLALAAGLQVTHNSKPPVGAKPTDTLTTLNLVYEIKNAKLAPE